MTTLKYLMWLSCLSKMRPKAKNIALEHFGGIKELFFADENELSKVEGLSKNEVKQLSNKNMDLAMRSLEICYKKNIGMMSIYDAAYPSRLKNIYDPPIMLFTVGGLPVIDEEVTIAIVGTRKSTSYGNTTATKLGYEISRGGGIIVSGLAGGIDTAGAIGALQASRPCVGVLGTAIDLVYPASNRDIFNDVARAGAIISEYPPLTEYCPSNFPNRNRIISGLSLGVVIIEAPKKSGALITAERAVEQGRDIFVVPGNVDAHNCVGSNELLKDGAKATMSGKDVLEEYEDLYPKKIDISQIIQMSPQRIPFRPREKRRIREKEPTIIIPAEKEEIQQVKQEDKSKEKIDLKEHIDQLGERQLLLISAFEDGLRDVDELVERTKIPSIEIMTEITMLEMLGFISSDGFNRYTTNF